ncbi:GtrA family protein [Chitinimonas sp.]|uniref:GtrA family protein n=1 Tax=Chitinimonas sp. TaxID=1934313 RepID=UPI002F93CC95
MPTKTGFLAQLRRFLLAGGLVAAIDTGCFMLLVQLGMPVIAGNALGMLLGFMLGLYLHHRYTFQVEGLPTWPIALRYLTAFGFNLGLGTLTMQLLTQLALPPLPAKLLTMGVVTLSNFLLGRYIVFKSIHRPHLSKYD